ncbi:hypothetical protein R8Z50_22155 [Longispora sp. K20-0274]|uniref:hypothetical protein n=1 Tax=Longispora sp. K20-0274 TaxID=3088255 RepID=UPI003999B461
MPAGTRLALIGATAYLALAATLSSWPGHWGVTRILPAAFTAAGVTLHRVAEADGTTCTSLATDTAEGPQTPRIQTLLSQRGCRQALRAAFIRDGDTIIVTLAALRLDSPEKALSVAGQLRDLNPQVRGLVLDHRRLPPGDTHAVMEESTTGTAVTLIPQAVGEWIVLTTAANGTPASATTTTDLYQAARDVTSYFTNTITHQTA